jgi:photosystem II stability/assembly factor-like uncharacterized protein
MKKSLYFLAILLLTMAACNLHTGGTETPTESVITEVPTAPPTGESVAIPLPVGLPVIASPSLLMIDFQDAANGWGLASTDTGYILRTEDAGVTWLNVTPPGLAEVGYSTHLSILDVNTVWALVANPDYVSGTLYHTADGGATWTSNPVPFGSASLQFLDPLTGRALADRGAGAGSNAVELYQTADGGLTWVSVFHNDPTLSGSSDSLPLGGIKNGMTFIDGSTGWVTGSYPMDGYVYLYVTHDGGNSWAMQTIPDLAAFETNQFMPFHPFFFGSEGFLPLTIYYPAGNIEQFFCLSHDSGATWACDPNNASQVVQPGRYSFADALNGFSWNGGTHLYFTTDGAQTWGGMAAALDLTDQLSQIDFVDSYTGWALSYQDDAGLSRLYHTADGGATWTQLIP